MQNILIERLEKYTDSDYERLVEMVIDTWDYRSWVPIEKIRPMAEIFLTGLLISASCVYVARQNEVIVGIIATQLSNVLDQLSKLHYYHINALSELLAQDSKKTQFTYYIETLKLDEKLIQESGKSFDATLLLFMVDAKTRGKGIGNQLYSLFLAYLQKNQAKNFYVLTDSASDYLFYEHKGLERLMAAFFYWGEDKSEATQEEYFVYEGKVFISEGSL